MIKDVFVLRKNSWHMSLMKWIWNLNYRDFSHICPYFWMSVLNIVIIIPVALFRGLAYLLKGMFGWIGDSLERRVNEKYERWLNRLQDNPQETLEWFAKACKADYNAFDGALEYRWGKISYSEREAYRAQLRELRIDREHAELISKYELKNQAEARAILRKRRIATIVKYVKPVAVFIGWGLMLILAAAIIFFLYKLVLLIATIPSKGWKIMGIIVGGIIIAIPTIIGLAMVLKWSFTRLACAIPSETPGWLKSIGAIFQWFGKGISTMWDIVTTMASNSCPFIDWED